MIPRDIQSMLGLVLAEPPVTQTNDSTAFVSEVIDMVSYMSGMFVIQLGTLSDADVTGAVLLEESDASDMSGSNEVADADMLSMTAGTAPETAAAFTFASDNSIKTLGYVGTKRYIRLTITPTGNNSGNLPISVLFVGEKRLQGTAN